MLTRGPQTLLKTKRMYVEFKLLIDLPKSALSAFLITESLAKLPSDLKKLFLTSLITTNYKSPVIIFQDF